MWAEVVPLLLVGRWVFEAVALIGSRISRALCRSDRPRIGPRPDEREDTLVSLSFCFQDVRNNPKTGG